MKHSSIPHLSKTRFGAGLQCHKQLFLQSHSPELADPLDPGQKAIFDTGIAVGTLARQRFKGGRLIGGAPRQHARAVDATRKVLEDQSVRAIYEGAFTFEDIRIRADILARKSGGAVHLVEVKSSTGVKDEHIPDVAIQLYVLEGSHVPIGRAFLLHIDNTYVYEGGPYDLGCLFRIEDVTDQARAFASSAVPGALAEMREVLRRPTVPDIEIGPHCTRPYRCAFYGHCRRNVPEYHIEQLPWVTATLLDKLLEAGIHDIREIPPDFPGLSARQRRVCDTVLTGQPWRDPAITAVLGSVTYPLHFLDFETFNPALPVYSGTHPYQVIPFQWSLHVRDSAGNLHHQSFLHYGNDDPRPPFCASLLDAIGPEGTIVVYSSFEGTILRQLAAGLPAFSARLLDLTGRMLDLLQVLREHYYHPGFHGSHSMKAVLPVLVPDLGYDDLEIQDGTQASVAFARMIARETPDSEKERLRKALLAYCARDTEAMVRVFDAVG